MRVQRQRVDVLPLTWEIPATIAVTWVVLAVVALPAGQSIAYAISGRGLSWPSGDLLASLGGLMEGRPGVGVAGRPPSDALAYAAIAFAEVIVAVLSLWAAAWWWRTTGPGAQYGLASRHEVRLVLGVHQLHRRRKTIRPDLGMTGKR